MPFGHTFEANDTSAVLKTFLPGSLVVAPVAPVHLTLTVTKIVEKLPLVHVARTPFEYTIATLPIVLVEPFIRVSFLTAFRPQTFTVT